MKNLLSQAELAKKLAQEFISFSHKNWVGKNGKRECIDYNHHYPFHDIDLSFTAHEKREALYKIEHELSRTDLAILKALSSYAEYFPQTFVSYNTLARIAGCCARTVLRRIRYLVKYRFIAVQYRPNRTNLYRVADYLLQKEAVETLARKLKMGVMVGLVTLFSTLSAKSIVEKKVAKQAVDQYNVNTVRGVPIKKEDKDIYMILNRKDENQKEEDNFSFRELSPPREKENRFNAAYAPKTFQKGDKQTFVGPLESLSYAQLQAELHKEFNKESFYTSNPKNLVGPDYRRVKALKAELARRDQQAKNDRGESIYTTIDF